MKAFRCGYVRPEIPALDDPSVILPAYTCQHIFTGPAALADHVRNWHKADPRDAKCEEMEVSEICHSCGRNSRTIKPNGEIVRVCENCMVKNLLAFLFNKSTGFNN